MNRDEIIQEIENEKDQRETTSVHLSKKVVMEAKQKAPNISLSRLVETLLKNFSKDSK